MASSGCHDDTIDRFARWNTHGVGVDVEEGGDDQDVLKEGREDVEEGGVVLMVLYGKLLSVHVCNIPTRDSTSRQSLRKRFRGAILNCSGSE